MDLKTSLTKAASLLQDHLLADRGIRAEDPLRANPIKNSNLTQVKRISQALVAAAALQASPIQAQTPISPQSLTQHQTPTYTTVTRAPQGNENSLKTALLSHRIHEALVGEHILRGNGAAPKHYIPIPGYVDPNNPPPDCRIGKNQKIEQNIIQPADQLHPALLKSLTGQISSTILKNLGDYAKKNSENWPDNRDTLAQNIQKIWSQTQNQPASSFRQLDEIDQAKYRRMADGLMYVTTLEKHLDTIENILNITHNEQEKNITPNPKDIAHRLQHLQIAQNLLKNSPLSFIPKQAIQEVIETTPERILKAAERLLIKEAPQFRPQRETPQRASYQPNL